MNKQIFILFSVLAIATAVLIGFTSRTQTLARGCFHQVAHKGEGCAALIKKSNGTFVLQLTGFSTTESPDLRVLLISEPDALENETVKNARQLDLGPMESAKGSQEYVVPAGQNLTDFHAVTIWNTKYRVNFTTAPLSTLPSGQ